MVRDREWKVLETRLHDQPDASPLTAVVCAPADELRPPEPTTFYHPVDKVEPLQAPPLEFRLDGMEVEWRRFHWSRAR